MARYRKVDPRIWNDAKFRRLSDSAKLVFFMLLTHPNMTALGAMRATVSGLAEELGWELKAFREAFQEVLSEGMAEHNQKACFLSLPNFLKYNPPESPNVVKAWIGAIDLLPECEQKTLVLQRSKAFAEGLSEGFAKALPEAFAKGMPYQEQEQEREQEQDSKPTASSPAKLPTCPVDLIVKAYHEILPELPSVCVIDASRNKAIRDRCKWVYTTRKPDGTLRAETPEQAIAWFKNYFGRARDNDFLMGKTPKASGHQGWKCDIDYLMTDKGLKQVIEKTEVAA